jgi:predicted phage-related endonuclease
VPRLTAAQLEEYERGFGAHEVPMILGLSSFGGLHDVVMRRLEPTERQPETLAQRLGHELEPIVARIIEEIEGVRLRNRSETIWHPRGLPLFCHLDRKVEGERASCEIKTTAWGADWGEPGDERAVPAGVRAQVAAQLACTGYEYSLVGVLIGGGDPRVYRVERNPELIAAIEEAVAEAWGFVERGEVPPPDGSDSSRAWLRKRYPHEEELELVATAEQRLLLDELRAADDESKTAAKRLELLEQRVMAAMGEASVLIAPEGRITWRTETPRADYRAIAEQLAGEEFERLVAEQKAGREGPRVLRKHWTKKGAAAA